MIVLWLGFSLLSLVIKHNMWAHYGWVRRSCHLINTICGRIMIGFIVVSPVSKDNAWVYYGWASCCCHQLITKYVVVL
jgi:hypothetical protein